jgi:hypothetical protein
MRRYSATLSSFVDGAKFAKVNNSCDWIIMLSRGRGLRVEYFASQIKTESSLRNFTKKAALFRFDYFPVGLESNVYGIVGCASSNDDSPIDETFVQKLVRFFLDVKFSNLISSKELDSLDFVK